MLPVSATELSLTPRRALEAIGWFAAVDTATLDALAGQAILHRVPAGSMLFEQAETPAFAQLLIRGSVELLAVKAGEELLVEMVEPPDLLLPAAVINRQPYLLRARVIDEAHLLLIHADTFRRAVSSDHNLCLAVLACQAAQFRRQVRQAKNIRLRSAEQRVGCYLRGLIERAAPGAPIRLPLEKRLIASHLGMTRETFSRTLASMSLYGLRVTGNLLAVDDMAKARQRFPLDPLIDGPEIIVPLGPES